MTVVFVINVFGIGVLVIVVSVIEMFGSCVFMICVFGVGDAEGAES